MPKISLNLPTSFYREEVRNDYKISANMKKVWAVELDLFKQLDQICKKHNITYYADSGTLLGAVRHHGFIPWDDDMDFIMLRSDFEKLCSVANEFKYPYFFQTEETDQGSLRCHAQLRNSTTTGILKSEQQFKYPFNQGIFIDIFPLDNVPDDIHKRKRYVKKLKQLKGRARSYYDYNSGIKNKVKVSGFRTLIKKILMPEYHCYLKLLWSINGDSNPFYKKYKRKVVEYDSKRTKFVMSIAVSNHYLYRDDIEDPIYVPFETINMPIPKNYERILKIYYGDWEKPVKASNVHGGCLFDTERSYKDYIK